MYDIINMCVSISHFPFSFDYHQILEVMLLIFLLLRWPLVCLVVKTGQKDVQYICGYIILLLQSYWLLVT